MTRASEILAIALVGRHCTERECRKCIARGHWYRRRGWRIRKHPSRRRTGRK